jgi:pimeloyl-ACP methyl ester carboxylesterase
LRDGRVLAYAEHGDPNGRPVFYSYFHGYPGSRLGARLSHEAAARAGVRLIALERPGFGRSSFQPGRTIAGWADEVAEAADALGIHRFAVAGVSGGGPYAAACAAKLAPRLTGAAIISGLGPLDVRESARGLGPVMRGLAWLGRRLPFLVALAMWLTRLLASRFTDAFIRLTSRNVPESDKALLRRPEVWSAIRDDLREAFRQGSRAAAHELSLYLRPWGFRLNQIAMEVQLWHGEADTNVPVVMGRYVARAIPRCRARLYPGEGHMLVLDHFDEILAALQAETPIASVGTEGDDG